MRYWILCGLTMIGGQLGSEAVATAQQGPRSGETYPCFQERQLLAAGRVQEAQPWHQRCLRVQQMARPGYGAPGGQAPIAPAPKKGFEPVAPSAPGGNGGAPALPPLPSVADVQRTVQGSDAKDTAARQEATFHVLVEFLEHITRHGMNNAPEQDMPPPAAKLWHEYAEAQTNAKRIVIPKTYNTEMSSTASLHYFLEEDFRRHALGQYVSASLVDGYESQHWGQEDKKNTEERERHAQDQAAGETEKSLSKDVNTAKQSGVDLTVFGVQLGAQMRLPPCQGSDSDNGLFAETLLGSSTSETCVVTRAKTFDQGLAQFVAATNSVPWVSSGVSVKLASSKCPDWIKAPFGCSVILNVKNGVALGATFQTNGISFEDKIVRSLTKKYNGKGPHEGGMTWCKNTLTGIITDKAPERHWSLPGLFVSYVPISSCSNTATFGRVTVELPQFREARDNVERKQEDAEPKM